ncbi:unnamed protein product, partial [marine sediment metagenome]
MRQEIQKFHSVTLAVHNAIMFDTLIYPHNIITEVTKQWILENKEGVEQPPVKGYFAMKDMEGKKTKYFISEDVYAQLPVRIDTFEEMLFKDSVKCKTIIHSPDAIKPFRIKPAITWDSHNQFINDLAPFKHTEPDQWTLNKIVAVTAYVSKTFIGVCSKSEFGKSSIYLTLDAITKKCPVFQPRSVPGVLAQITGDGNIVFDETHDAPTEVKNCMENFSLQVGGNTPVYINGAMKAANTKPRYDVAQQSITYLYNVYSNY